MTISERPRKSLSSITARLVEQFFQIMQYWWQNVTCCQALEARVEYEILKGSFLYLFGYMLGAEVDVESDVLPHQGAGAVPQIRDGLQRIGEIRPGGMQSDADGSSPPLQ